MGEKERTGGLVEKNDLSVLNIGQRFFRHFFLFCDLIVQAARERHNRRIVTEQLHSAMRALHQPAQLHRLQIAADAGFTRKQQPGKLSDRHFIFFLQQI